MVELSTQERELWARRQHALGKKWSTSGTLIVADETLIRQIEGCVHELCHAAVLNIPFYDRYVEDRVLEWFDAGEHADKVQDHSECRALAVESLIIRPLALPIDMDLVCRIAVNAMKVLDTSETQELMHAFMMVPITRRRAAKVVRAVRKVWRDAGVD